MAFRYEGKIPAMEYKTLRYPGHAQHHGGRFASSDCSTLEPVDVKGVKVVPRDAFMAIVVQPQLTKPEGARSRRAASRRGRHEGRHDGDQVRSSSSTATTKSTTSAR